MDVLYNIHPSVGSDFDPTFPSVGSDLTIHFA